MIDKLSTLKNSKMNNLTSIDFAIRDWIDDTDYILPRICTEYPKNSSTYLTKASDTKPWGDREPINMDPY